MLPPEAFSLAAMAAQASPAARLAGVTRRLEPKPGGIPGRSASRPQARNLRARCWAPTARAPRTKRGRRSAAVSIPGLASCKASFADPANDEIMLPAHPAVSHNAQVMVTLAQHGLRDAGLDATPWT